MDTARACARCVSSRGLKVACELAIDTRATGRHWLRHAPAAEIAQDAAEQVRFVVPARRNATVAGWTARGIGFPHSPRATNWRYGAKSLDPNGCPTQMWDVCAMKQR
jgi:hypothetical protein